MQHRAERIGGQEDCARLAHLVNAPAEFLKRRDRTDQQQHAQQRGGGFVPPARPFFRQKPNGENAQRAERRDGGAHGEIHIVSDFEHRREHKRNLCQPEDAAFEKARPHDQRETRKFNRLKEQQTLDGVAKPQRGRVNGEPKRRAAGGCVGGKIQRKNGEKAENREQVARSEAFAQQRGKPARKPLDSDFARQTAKRRADEIHHQPHQRQRRERERGQSDEREGADVLRRGEKQHRRQPRRNGLIVDPEQAGRVGGELIALRPPFDLVPPGLGVETCHQHIHARKEHEQNERQADFAEHLHLCDGEHQQEYQRQKPDCLHEERRVCRGPEQGSARQRGEQLADQRGQNPEADVIIQRVRRSVKIHRPAVAEQIVKDGVAPVMIFVLVEAAADAGEKRP